MRAKRHCSAFQSLTEKQQSNTIYNMAFWRAFSLTLQLLALARLLAVFGAVIIEEGERREDGPTILRDYDVPLDTMPVFVRQGSPQTEKAMQAFTATP
jgi:hypothetical protein